jgi:hypothetical protein
MSKYGLDQFYTKKSVVQQCLKTIDVNSFDLVIEPSAGDGAFFDEIYNPNKIGYDIDPKSNNIIKQDYLDLDVSFFENKKVLVIGNPPFGRNSKMALAFIKKSTYADTIAFILPKGFKKRSMIDKIPLNFEIECVQDLNDENFYYEGKDYHVPCVWMILKKTNKLRKKETKLEPNFFRFVDKLNANVAIRRVGVNAGKPFLDVNVSKQSHYFIYVENPNRIVEILNPNLFGFNDTTGPRSISKNELISVIERNFVQ